MRLKEGLKRCGYTLVERGLVWGHSGNISARVDSNTFLISASGTDLGNLDDDDILTCQVKDKAFQGAKSPSIEKGLHQAIYQVHQDAGAAIHSQPPYTTLVACSNMDIRTDILPETMAYLGKVERVPYHHAGSDDLAHATAEKARGSHTLLLDNHGAVCWGSDIDEALLRTQTLEFLCQLLVLSNKNSIALNYLGQEVVASFLKHLESIGRV